MQKVTIAALVPGDRAATVAGLVELAVAARPNDEVDVLWFAEPPRRLPAVDAVAIAEGVDAGLIDEIAVPRLRLGAAVPGWHCLRDPALFQPAFETPVRTLERIVVVAGEAGGLGTLPRVALAAAAERWRIELLADRPEAAAEAPAGLPLRVLPRGRAWGDLVLRSQLVIALDHRDAVLANAMLRPAVWLGGGAIGGDWPFLWPTEPDRLVERLAGYDPEQGGPLLFNWKRGAEAAARATVDAWLAAAVR